MKEGDQLYFVPDRLVTGRSNPYHVTVQKVGRKWLHIDHNRRVDAATLEVDGGQYSSPGRCYRTQEEYEFEKFRQNLWFELRAFMGNTFSVPENVSIEALATVQALLNMPNRKDSP